MSRKRRVLIVGGSSFIAKSLRIEFDSEFRFESTYRDKGSDIRIDLETHKFPEEEKLEKFETAIILAGMTNIQEIEIQKNKSFRVNNSGTKKLIDHLNACGIRCLFLSSTCVFGEERLGYEDSKKNPKSLYGKYKSEVEDYALTNELNSILRITKVFAGNSVLNEWNHRLSRNEKINAYYDLRVAPLHISYITQEIANWIRDPINGIVHVSPENDLTYYMLAEQLTKMKGYDTRLIEGKYIKDTKKTGMYVPKFAYLGINERRSRKYQLKEAINKIISDL